MVACVPLDCFFFLSRSLPQPPPPLLSRSSPSFQLPQKDERSLVPRSLGNEISALPSLPALLPFSISASQENGGVLDRTKRAAVLLSQFGWRGGKKYPPNECCLSLASGDSTVWAKHLPPASDHFTGRLYGW